ncbi:SPOSA6832_03720, partial [Sporobolomyces salmonicolor]
MPAPALRPSPAPAPAAAVAEGASKIALHRRGTADLTNEDGTVNVARAHAHLARARAKYVRGLRNFERNTGSAHVLAPSRGVVDPSLLPASASPGSSAASPHPPNSNSTDSTPREAFERRAPAPWGVGGAENASLEFPPAAAATAGEAKRDKVFDPSSARLRGVPRIGEVGIVKNQRALARRTVKNPKVVWNPKAHPSSSLSARTTTTSAAAAAKTGAVALTAYDDMTRELFAIVIMGRAEKRGARGLTSFALDVALADPVWAGSMSIGTPAKTFIIDFDTGSADLWVPSVNCTSAACNPHTKYNPAGSSSAVSVPGKKLSITYGDGSSAQGTAWTDTVTSTFLSFLEDKGLELIKSPVGAVAGMTATAQTLGAANSLTSDFQDDPYDGLMGMAYSSIATLGSKTVFDTLVSESKTASSQFSFYLAASGSELYLGGMDQSKYTAGSTVFYPVTSQSYWLLATQANVGGSAVSALGTFSAIVDTGTSVIVPLTSLLPSLVQAPTSAAEAFWAAVPNSGVYGSGYYTYECASPPSISFSFGSSNAEQWAVAGDSLNLGRVSSGSDRCVGAIVGADIGINAWILGDSFLENVYSTFDLSTNSVGFSDLA